MNIDLNGVACHYDIADDGKPLVLLHGFTGSSVNWRPFTFLNHKTIAPDLLGHGRSATPSSPQRYRMEQTAVDLAQLIEKESGGQKARLLGYSMGGRLALYLTLRFPDLFEALILESASPGLATEAERVARRQRDNALADRIERDGIEAFVEFWEALPLWESQRRLSAAARLAQRRQRLQNNPAGLANSLRGMGTGVQPALWERLGELQLPVLLVVGEQDRKFVRIAEQMAAQIPIARVDVVAGAGHTAHLERPSTFTAVVERFLAGLG